MGGSRTAAARQSRGRSGGGRGGTPGGQQHHQGGAGGSDSLKNYVDSGGASPSPTASATCDRSSSIQGGVASGGGGGGGAGCNDSEEERFWIDTDAEYFTAIHPRLLALLHHHRQSSDLFLTAVLPYLRQRSEQGIVEKEDFKAARCHGEEEKEDQGGSSMTGAPYGITTTRMFSKIAGRGQRDHSSGGIPRRLDGEEDGVMNEETEGRQTNSVGVGGASEQRRDKGKEELKEEGGEPCIDSHCRRVAHKAEEEKKMDGREEVMQTDDGDEKAGSRRGSSREGNHDVRSEVLLREEEKKSTYEKHNYDDGGGQGGSGPDSHISSSSSLLSNNETSFARENATAVSSHPCVSPRSRSSLHPADVSAACSSSSSSHTHCQPCPPPDPSYPPRYSHPRSSSSSSLPFPSQPPSSYPVPPTHFHCMQSFYPGTGPHPPTVPSPSPGVSSTASDGQRSLACHEFSSSPLSSSSKSVSLSRPLYSSSPSSSSPRSSSSSLSSSSSSSLSSSTLYRSSTVDLDRPTYSFKTGRIVKHAWPSNLLVDCTLCPRQPPSSSSSSSQQALLQGDQVSSSFSSSSCSGSHQPSPSSCSRSSRPHGAGPSSSSSSPPSSLLSAHSSSSFPAKTQPALTSSDLSSSRHLSPSHEKNFVKSREAPSTGTVVTGAGHPNPGSPGGGVREGEGLQHHDDDGRLSRLPSLLAAESAGERIEEGREKDSVRVLCTKTKEIDDEVRGVSTEEESLLKNQKEKKEDDGREYSLKRQEQLALHQQREDEEDCSSSSLSHRSDKKKDEDGATKNRDLRSGPDEEGDADHRRRGQVHDAFDNPSLAKVTEHLQGSEDALKEEKRDDGSERRRDEPEIQGDLREGKERGTREEECEEKNTKEERATMKATSQQVEKSTIEKEKHKGECGNRSGSKEHDITEIIKISDEGERSTEGDKYAADHNVKREEVQESSLLSSSSSSSPALRSKTTASASSSTGENEKLLRPLLPDKSSSFFPPPCSSPKTPSTLLSTPSPTPLTALVSPIASPDVSGSSGLTKEENMVNHVGEEEDEDPSILSIYQKNRDESIFSLVPGSNHPALLQSLHHRQLIAHLKHQMPRGRPSVDTSSPVGGTLTMMATGKKKDLREGEKHKTHYSRSPRLRNKDSILEIEQDKDDVRKRSVGGGHKKEMTIPFDQGRDRVYYEMDDVKDALHSPRKKNSRTTERATLVNELHPHKSISQPLKKESGTTTTTRGGETLEGKDKGREHSHPPPPSSSSYRSSSSSSLRSGPTAAASKTPTMMTSSGGEGIGGGGGGHSPSSRARGSATGSGKARDFEPKRDAIGRFTSTKNLSNGGGRGGNESSSQQKPQVSKVKSGLLSSPTNNSNSKKKKKNLPSNRHHPLHLLHHPQYLHHQNTNISKNRQGERKPQQEGGGGGGGGGMSTGRRKGKDSFFDSSTSSGDSRVNKKREGTFSSHMKGKGRDERSPLVLSLHDEDEDTKANSIERDHLEDGLGDEDTDDEGGIDRDDAEEEDMLLRNVFVPTVNKKWNGNPLPSIQNCRPPDVFVLSLLIPDHLGPTDFPPECDTAGDMSTFLASVIAASTTGPSDWMIREDGREEEEDDHKNHEEVREDQQNAFGRSDSPYSVGCLRGGADERKADMARLSSSSDNMLRVTTMKRDKEGKVTRDTRRCSDSFCGRVKEGVGEELVKKKKLDAEKNVKEEEDSQEEEHQEEEEDIIAMEKKNNSGGMKPKRKQDRSRTSFEEDRIGDKTKENARALITPSSSSSSLPKSPSLRATTGATTTTTTTTATTTTTSRLRGDSISRKGEETSSDFSYYNRSGVCSLSSSSSLASGSTGEGLGGEFSPPPIKREVNEEGRSLLDGTLSSPPPSRHSVSFPSDSSHLLALTESRRRCRESSHLVTSTRRSSLSLGRGERGGGEEEDSSSLPEQQGAPREGRKRDSKKHERLSSQGSIYSSSSSGKHPFSSCPSSPPPPLPSRDASGRFIRRCNSDSKTETMTATKGGRKTAGAGGEEKIARGRFLNLEGTNEEDDVTLKKKNRRDQMTSTMVTMIKEREIQQEQGGRGGAGKNVGIASKSKKGGDHVSRGGKRDVGGFVGEGIVKEKITKKESKTRPPKGSDVRKEKRRASSKEEEEEDEGDTAMESMIECYTSEELPSHTFLVSPLELFTPRDRKRRLSSLFEGGRTTSYQGRRKRLPLPTILSGPSPAWTDCGRIPLNDLCHLKPSSSSSLPPFMNPMSSFTTNESSPPSYLLSPTSTPTSSFSFFPSSYPPPPPPSSPFPPYFPGTAPTTTTSFPGLFASSSSLPVPMAPSYPSPSPLGYLSPSGASSDALRENDQGSCSGTSRFSATGITMTKRETAGNDTTVDNGSREEAPGSVEEKSKKDKGAEEDSDMHHAEANTREEGEVRIANEEGRQEALTCLEGEKKPDDRPISSCSPRARQEQTQEGRRDEQDLSKSHSASLSSSSFIQVDRPSCVSLPSLPSNVPLPPPAPPVSAASSSFSQTPCSPSAHGYSSSPTSLGYTTTRPSCLGPSHDQSPSPSSSLQAPSSYAGPLSSSSSPPPPSSQGGGRGESGGYHERRFAGGYGPSCSSSGSHMNPCPSMYYGPSVSSYPYSSSSSLPPPPLPPSLPSSSSSYPVHEVPPTTIAWVPCAPSSSVPYFISSSSSGLQSSCYPQPSPPPGCYLPPPGSSVVYYTPCTPAPVPAPPSSFLLLPSSSSCYRTSSSLSQGGDSSTDEGAGAARCRGRSSPTSRVEEKKGMKMDEKKPSCSHDTEEAPRRLNGPSSPPVDPYSPSSPSASSSPSSTMLMTGENLPSYSRSSYGPPSTSFFPPLSSTSLPPPNPPGPLQPNMSQGPPASSPSVMTSSSSFFPSAYSQPPFSSLPPAQMPLSGCTPPPPSLPLSQSVSCNMPGSTTTSSGPIGEFKPSHMSTLSAFYSGAGYRGTAREGEDSLRSVSAGRGGEGGHHSSTSLLSSPSRRSSASMPPSLPHLATDGPYPPPQMPFRGVVDPSSSSSSVNYSSSTALSGCYDEGERGGEGRTSPPHNNPSQVPPVPPFSTIPPPFMPANYASSSPPPSLSPTSRRRSESAGTSSHSYCPSSTQQGCRSFSSSCPPPIPSSIYSSTHRRPPLHQIDSSPISAPTASSHLSSSARGNPNSSPSLPLLPALPRDGTISCSSSSSLSTIQAPVYPYNIPPNRYDSPQPSSSHPSAGYQPYSSYEGRSARRHDPQETSFSSNPGVLGSTQVSGGPAAGAIAPSCMPSTTTSSSSLGYSSLPSAQGGVGEAPSSSTHQSPSYCHVPPSQQPTHGGGVPPSPCCPLPPILPSSSSLPSPSFPSSPSLPLPSTTYFLPPPCPPLSTPPPSLPSPPAGPTGPAPLFPLPLLPTYPGSRPSSSSSSSPNLLSNRQFPSSLPLPPSGVLIPPFYGPASALKPSPPDCCLYPPDIAENFRFGNYSKSMLPSGVPLGLLRASMTKVDSVHTFYANRHGSERLPGEKSFFDISSENAQRHSMGLPPLPAGTLPSLILRPFSECNSSLNRERGGGAFGSPSPSSSPPPSGSLMCCPSPSSPPPPPAFPFSSSSLSLSPPPLMPTHTPNDPPPSSGDRFSSTSLPTSVASSPYPGYSSSCSPPPPSSFPSPPQPFPGPPSSFPPFYPSPSSCCYYPPPVPLPPYSSSSPPLVRTCSSPPCVLSGSFQQSCEREEAKQPSPRSETRQEKGRGRKGEEKGIDKKQEKKGRRRTRSVDDVYESKLRSALGDKIREHMLKSHLAPLPGQIFLPSGLHVLPSTYLSLQEREKRGRMDDVGRTSLSSMSPHAIGRRTAEQGDCRHNEKDEGMKGRMMNGGGEKKGDSLHEEDVNLGIHDSHASLSQSPQRQDVSTSRTLPPSIPHSLSVASSSSSLSTSLSSSSLLDQDTMKSTSAIVSSSQNGASGPLSKTGNVDVLLEEEEEKGMVDVHVKTSSCSKKVQQPPLLLPGGGESISTTIQSSSSLSTSKEEGKDHLKTLIVTSFTHPDRHARCRRLSDYTAASPLVRPGDAPHIPSLHSQVDRTEEESRQQGDRGLSERRRRSYAGEERPPSKMIIYDDGPEGGASVLAMKKEENRRVLSEDKEVALVRENKQEGEREKEIQGGEGEMQGESSSKSDMLDCLTKERGERALLVESGENVKSTGSTSSRGGEQGGEQGKVSKGEDKEGEEEELMIDENDVAGGGDGKDRNNKQETKKNGRERDSTDNTGKDDQRRGKTEEEQVYASKDTERDKRRLSEGKDGVQGGGEDQQDDVEMNESSSTSALITSMHADMTATKNDASGHKKTTEEEKKTDAEQKRAGGGEEEEQTEIKGKETEENKKTCDLEKNRHGDQNMDKNTADKGEEEGSLAVLMNGVPKSREFFEIGDVKRKEEEKDLEERQHQEKSAMTVMTTRRKSSELHSRKDTSSSYSRSSLIAVEVENLLWRFAALVEEKKAICTRLLESVQREKRPDWKGWAEIEDRMLRHYIEQSAKSSMDTRHTYTLTQQSRDIIRLRVTCVSSGSLPPEWAERALCTVCGSGEDWDE
ncbi:phd-finger domain-containing protein, partial [Cystoisospora suis]